MTLLIALLPLLHCEDDLRSEHDGVLERVVKVEDTDEIGVLLVFGAAHEPHFEVEGAARHLEPIGCKEELQKRLLVFVGNGKGKGNGNDKEGEGEGDDLFLG